MTLQVTIGSPLWSDYMCYFKVLLSDIWVVLTRVHPSWEQLLPSYSIDLSAGDRGLYAAVCGGMLSQGKQSYSATELRRDKYHVTVSTLIVMHT